MGIQQNELPFSSSVRLLRITDTFESVFCGGLARRLFSLRLPTLVNDLYLSDLEAAWEPETGFLGCLRDGIFDQALFGDFVTTLMRVRVAEDALLPARFVTLLWFIPLFMEWQTERVIVTCSPEEYALARTRIEQQLERILGFP
jgi:hypothetical protein